MRETFPREAAAAPEAFTGERLTGSVHGQVELEHYHRYLFSRAFCRDRDVLDVASGEGYGAAQLAQVARSVVGVEFAGATASNAAANFPRPNLWFLQADARSLPLNAGCVDVVTSFETIEHFDRQEEFVAEVRRVLRPDGSFIVSTPDRDVYSPPGSTLNEFHVREFDRSEFLDLLHRHFRYVTLVRQRAMLVSGLFPEEAAAISPRIFERAEDQAFSLDTVLPKAPYLIAIASELAPRLAPVSLLVERGELDNFRFAEQAAEIERSRQSEAAAREAADAARQATDAARQAGETAHQAAETAHQVAHAARLDADAARLDADAARLEADAARLEADAARLDADAARRMAEQSAADARATVVTLTHTRAALVQANSDLDRISGSARHFMRQYVPRLWRFLTR
jgi:SAM-dependent methyltransferase